MDSKAFDLLNGMKNNPQHTLNSPRGISRHWASRRAERRESLLPSHLCTNTATGYGWAKIVLEVAA